MDFHGDHKLITCILPRGNGAGLVKALDEELGIKSANVATGRGVSARASYFSEEVDILGVVVPGGRADGVFEFLYERSELDHSRGRFMFQAPLMAAKAFSLLDLPDEPASAR